MNAIEVRSVSKRFTIRHNPAYGLKDKFLGIFDPRKTERVEEHYALRDVSFSIPAGQSVAIVGPNGSGKSTLLQIIAGITAPTSGEVICNGRLAAIIELGAGLVPELTGLENIFLTGTLLGLTNREVASQLRAIVDFSGLGSFIDTPTKNYSSGMAMRLAFSVAIFSAPQVLLADEVLAVGDADFQQKARVALRQLQDRGTSLILVTHAPGQAREFCDATLHLESGRLRSYELHADTAEPELDELPSPDRRY